MNTIEAMSNKIILRVENIILIEKRNVCSCSRQKRENKNKRVLHYNQQKGRAVQLLLAFTNYNG